MVDIAYVLNLVYSIILSKYLKLFVSYYIITNYNPKQNIPISEQNYYPEFK
jgi:hypothetical protein